MTHCVRTIKFTIPGTLTSPGVEVYVEEQNGTLVFTATVIETGGLTADLRGLFFNVKNDASTLNGLAAAGSKVTDFDTTDVIDLGNGANMHGAHSAFDVGVEFGHAGIGKGDDIKTATFTLTNSTNSLTLDDIANVDFGARLTSVGAIGGSRNGSSKLTTTAPAAPDAVDDNYHIFEDGQSGVGDPSKVSEGVKFEVLANDTDADPGTKLRIDDVEGAQHGTVTIIDGDDADLLPGDAVLYTPVLDYAGADSFTYCITDDQGGTDFAEVFVTVEAVAEVPEIAYEVIAGATVDQFILRVTATQQDADSSEFMDRILLSVPGGLPGGSIAPGSVNPGDEPDSITQDFVITLPQDQDTSYDLNITAWSEETSNGDQESATVVVPIVYEYNSTTKNVEFSADDQSIWSSGPQYVLDDNRFLGIDTGPFDKSAGSTLYAGINGSIKLGFESKLHFEGGEIDATSFYDVTVETNYNKTTDQLLIDTAALLTDAVFDTEFAEGTYKLDFVWDVLVNAFAGVNIDLGSFDVDVLGIIPGDQTIDFGSIDERIEVKPDIGPGRFNLLSLGSDDVAGTFDFPAPLDAFSVNFDWPDLVTSGDAPPNPVSADGESNNVLELVLDADELFFQILSKALGSPVTVNPLDPPRLTAGPVFADLDILDIDVFGGINLLQDFKMQQGGLTGFLMFEDGTNQAFAIGDSLFIDDASAIDAGGDGDGLVEFQFEVIPTSTLRNETAIGFNIGYDIDFFTLELGYDVSIPNPFSALVGPDSFGFSDSKTFDSLATFDGSTPIGEVEIYDETFVLNYAQQQIDFFA